MSGLVLLKQILDQKAILLTYEGGGFKGVQIPVFLSSDSMNLSPSLIRFGEKVNFKLGKLAMIEGPEIEPIYTSINEFEYSLSKHLKQVKFDHVGSTNGFYEEGNAGKDSLKL